MLEQTSNDFRKIFLLKFTKALIENSSSMEIIKLEKILANKEKNLEEQKNKETKYIQQEVKKFEKQMEFPPLQRVSSQQRIRLQPIRIPPTRLPPQFQYLKPTPINQEIDLGKLNPLTKDPNVKVIECPGPDQNISVVTGNKIKTAIILTKEEINQIIETFAKMSKIPINEGHYRVAVGRFILSATISKTDSNFTIEKIRPTKRTRY